jgi:hypothetical protein
MPVDPKSVSMHSGDIQHRFQSLDAVLAGPKQRVLSLSEAQPTANESEQQDVGVKRSLSTRLKGKLKRLRHSFSNNDVEVRTATRLDRKSLEMFQRQYSPPPVSMEEKNEKIRKNWLVHVGSGGPEDEGIGEQES